MNKIMIFDKETYCKNGFTFEAIDINDSYYGDMNYKGIQFRWIHKCLFSEYSENDINDVIKFATYKNLRIDISSIYEMTEFSKVLEFFENILKEY